jgi:molybdopterin synthase sulfur carrier subunit
MEVNVKLFANLRDGHFKEKKANLKDNSRVIDVINMYDLPIDDVALCFVNGRDADDNHVLHNGDTVSLFPRVYPELCVNSKIEVK